MRNFLLAALCFFLCPEVSAQNNIEMNCLEEMKRDSSRKVFSKFSGTIASSTDTIIFDNSLMTIQNTNPALLEILRMGLIYPSLISGNETRPINIQVKIHRDTLSISNLAELTSLPHQINSRIFSFLLWDKGFANPSLYLFELTTPELNPEASFPDFLNKAKLTAFGFCSILI